MPFDKSRKEAMNKLQFNKPVKILAEGFNYREALEVDNDGQENKEVKLTGLALTLGKPTRNGVIYSMNDASKMNTMVGKPFLDTHNDNSALNTFGRVSKFWKEGNNLMYEVVLDPEEKNFIRKVKNKFIPGVSVQVLCDTAEEGMDGNIHANIESFLELSAVTIPGEGDSTATLLEAFGRKPKGIISKGGAIMKEEYPPQDMPNIGSQDVTVNPRDDLAEPEPKPKKEKKKDTTPDFSMTRCIKKMAPHMDEPGAFCRWAYDRGHKKYGEAIGDEINDYDMDEFYTNYEEYVKESIRYGKEKCGSVKKEDLTTAPDSGGALIADEAPMDRKEQNIAGMTAAAAAGDYAGYHGTKALKKKLKGEEQALAAAAPYLGAAGVGAVTGAKRALDEDDDGKEKLGGSRPLGMGAGPFGVAGMAARKVMNKENEEEDFKGGVGGGLLGGAIGGPVGAVGGALLGSKLPKEERIYDPLKKRMVKPNYEGEDELEDALDDIQGTGNKAKPEDKRNMIPGAKKAQVEKISRKLREMTTRVKKIEINRKIEKLNNKLEGIKNGQTTKRK